MPYGRARDLVLELEKRGYKFRVSSRNGKTGYRVSVKRTTKNTAAAELLKELRSLEGEVCTYLVDRAKNYLREMRDIAGS